MTSHVNKLSSVDLSFTRKVVYVRYTCYIKQSVDDEGHLSLLCRNCWLVININDSKESNTKDMLTVVHSYNFVAQRYCLYALITNESDMIIVYI